MKKNFKIGIDARMYSESFGIGRYILEITKRIFLEKNNINWVIFMNEPAFSKYKFPKNVKKVLVNAGHYSLAEQTKFVHILNKEKCNLVHFCNFNLPIFFSGKFIVTIHDTTISFFPGKKMNSWWRKIAYNLVMLNSVKRSQDVITVSENTKKDVIRLFGNNKSREILEKKITPILIAPSDEFHTISDLEKIQIKKKYRLPPKYIIYTGNWREHKNLTGLLKAFSILRKKHSDLELVITGKEDPCYPEVLEISRDLELENSVKFVGCVDFNDLKKLTAAAFVYVFPSFYEGFGMPPLEAMSCEVPCAVSNTSSIPEVCGDAAIYFDPEKEREMAQEIEKLLNDSKLREKIIKKGKKQVQKFDWDKTSKKTLEVYLKNLKNYN